MKVLRWVTGDCWAGLTGLAQSSEEGSLRTGLRLGGLRPTCEYERMGVVPAKTLRCLSQQGCEQV